MGCQGPAEFSDLSAHLDELLDVLVCSFASHRVDVEVLESLLDLLERGRVGTQDPFQERGQKAWPVKLACVPGSGYTFGEFL